mgnify:CR=1 FL=1
MTLTLGNINEAVSAALPDRTAIIYRDRRLTYAQVAERSRRLANFFLDQGITVHRERDELENWESGQDHVAIYMFNCNEYVEAMLATWKARAAQFNVNYRYVREELEYLLNDADAKAIVFHARFAPVIAEVRAQVPTLRLFIQVDDGSGEPLLDGAFDYEQVIADASDVPPPVTSSLDDVFILYTGGTTGMPKGVLWRQEDAYMSQMGGLYNGRDRIADLDECVHRAVTMKSHVIFPPPPFMHGAGCYLAVRALNEGNTLLIPNVTDRFDAADALVLIERERANLFLTIGDAFGRPLLDELRRRDYDVSSLRYMTNTGAIMSKGVKAGLMEKIPGLTIIDSLGASETGVQAQHVSSAAGASAKADFLTVDNTIIVSDDRQRTIERGSSETGWLAKKALVPLGYYGDKAKTKQIFPVIDGVRYAIGGDKVRLLENGEIEFFGRESVTINSGGEKIFAEEVEEALKPHPSVADVLVAGRPSERWGNEVVAMIELRDGAEPDEAGLLAEAGKHIARYKLPKAFLFVERVGRLANGKPDYRWAKRTAEASA